MVKVKAHFKRRSTANNVEIYVPVPDDADTPKFRVCLSCQCATPLPIIVVSRRRLQARCSMLRTNRPSCGRSNSWAAPVSSSCVRTLAYQACGEVRILHIDPLHSTLSCCRRTRKHGQTCSYHGEIRDTLFYGLGHPSEIPQDCREEWISGSAVGEVHHTEWGRLQVRRRIVFSHRSY